MCAPGSLFCTAEGKFSMQGKEMKKKKDIVQLICYSAEICISWAWEQPLPGFGPFAWHLMNCTTWFIGVT
jgi:hypothetical protein